MGQQLDIKGSMEEELEANALVHYIILESTQLFGEKLSYFTRYRNIFVE